MSTPPDMVHSFRHGRAIRAALAGKAYAQDLVRIHDDDLRGFECLVASRQGLFAVRRDGFKPIAYGFFFGLHRHGDRLLVFEACDQPRMASNMGRVIELVLRDGRIAGSRVLIRGLDNQCHQLAVIDELICVMDTANQEIPRFTLDGDPVDVRRPFPRATRGDAGPDYFHINSIAAVRGTIAVMMHMGGREPQRPSELAWLDADWGVVRRDPLAGYCCHDIVEDPAGELWHCGSMGGDLLRSSGPPVHVSDRMTRGLALGRDGWIVGASDFGNRSARVDLAGGVIFMNGQFAVDCTVDLPAAPTDLIAIAE